MASLGQRVCYTDLGDRVCQHPSFWFGSLWVGLLRHILNDLEQYFLGKKMHKGLFS